MMSPESKLSSKSQSQGNVVKNINVSGDFTFTPVQIGTEIQTQIIQMSAPQVTQKPFIKASPYQGMRKFNVQDRERFFGRDKLIARLFKAVNQSSLNLVLGASGSGKSSVVRAGLIPELKKSLESKIFYDFIFTPHHNPFESFYRCLLNQEKDYHFTEAEAEIAKIAEANTIKKVISNLKQDNEKWLIFIDQFEEVFTDCQDINIRKKFIEAIVRVASMNDSSVRIVLAMRSDFLDQVGFHPHFGEIINKQQNIHLLTEMYPDELRQAIEQPAAKHGVVFEEGLVEQIIDDVEGQSGYLPLLQYTLNLLWEREFVTSPDAHTCIEDRVLNNASYIDLEGVRGALQKRVDKIYQSLSQDEKEATRHIFINLVNIVETNSGRKAVTRRGYCKEFTEGIVKKTIDMFVDENLLITSNECSSNSKLMLGGVKKIKDAGTVEIAHEILLLSWETLKQWIEQEKEAILLKSWLAIEAQRWHKIYSDNRDRARDELLKGSRLQQIIEYRNREGFKKLGGLNQDENIFIDASIAWREQTIKSEKLQLVLKGLLVGVTTLLIVAALFVFAVGASKTCQLQPQADIGTITMKAKQYINII